MERIQEAIEKARRERQGNIGREAKSAGEESAADDIELTPESGAEPQIDDLPAGDPQAEAPAESEQLADEVEPEITRTLSAQTGAASIRVKYSDTRTITLDESELKDRRIVAGFAHDSRSEPYRQLRGQVLKKFRENNWQTLAVTSPKAGSGRTLTAVNLAISLSLEANQTVLLVDLDLRNPGVADTLGLTEINAGLVDYPQ